jgi:integrase
MQRAIDAALVLLGDRTGTGARVTATRAKETLAARWEEFGLKAKLWTIPAARMTKTGKEHRVPLSDRAIELLAGLDRSSEYVFPGPAGRAGDDTFRRELVRLGRVDVDPHGFRSTFSTWAAERTRYSYEARELSLAHAVGNAVERSYQRGELLAERRRLMEDRARFCASPAADAENVVAIRG